MKLNSKYFDSIRVSRKGQGGGEKPVAAERVRDNCQWKGCDKSATHKAPMGRGRDGQYYRFCIDHVRQYNATYNYFDGMSDADVERFQKDSITGHRPTWKLGAQAEAGVDSQMGRKATSTSEEDAPSDPHEFFAWRAKQARTEDPAKRRQLKPLERKSLEALDLPQHADRETIKARFKLLVKTHHPDANGGDKRSEDKLREIIQAYNYLKQAGLV
ncbi:MAG: J domain-containing protein [Hyphomicrobiaceae bacterium]|nr:J domain-containing protein [Hyphomicrobiaceae bacterium]